MDEITLFSTDCPKCKILEKKLEAKGVKFNIIKGAESIAKLGLTSAPILQVNNKLMEFSEANAYINTISKVE